MGRAPCWALTLFVCACNLAAGQELALPDAVEQPPAWLLKDAPYDLARFFTLPPGNQNAAPLYLDALAEFSGEMAVCFPPGEEQDLRFRLVRERNQTLVAVDRTFHDDPKRLRDDALERATAPYQIGFLKLVEAQQRPKCVFVTGIGAAALIPHVQAARQVGRVAALRVRRALDRSAIDAALGDVALVLRLSRDLRPRGYFVNQLVANAIDASVHKDMVLPILAYPALKPEHCDRLLALLTEHETQSIDSFTEGVKAEWITSRVMLNELMHNREELARKMNVPPGAPIIATVTQFVTVMPPGAPQVRRRIGPDLGRLLLQAAETKVTGMTDTDAAPGLAKVGDQTRALLRLDGVPYAERLRTLPDPNKTLAGDDPVLVVRRAIEPATEAFTLSEAKHETTLHALISLVALRRWQLTHPDSTVDLSEAVKAAGLSAVPLDPYDGKPLRTARINGETVVYSVGKDGRDDRGAVDSKNETQPGDLVYSLLPVRNER